MRKILRIALWILGGLLLLIIVAILIINTRPVKNLVRTKAVAFLNKKLGTEVIIGDLNYALPKWIVLNDVLIRDETKDTLLAVHQLKVDMDMLQLINSNVAVQKIMLDGVNAHIYRHAPDTNFNFAFIIKAFATAPKDTPKDTTKGNLTMSLDKLLLSNIRFRFDDYTGGNRFALQLDTLSLSMRKLDINTMTFEAKKLFIAGLNGGFIQDTSYLPPTPPSDNALTLHLAAEEINLNRISYKQQNVQDKFLMNVHLGAALLHPHNINLINQFIAIKDMKLDDAHINILMGKHQANKAVAKIDSIVTKPNEQPSKWKIMAGVVALNNVNFILNNENQLRQKQGIDYGHLNVQQLVLNAQELLYTTDTISANIKHLAVKEQSGLDVQELKTRFVYHPQGAVLHDLYLQTSNTILQNYAFVQYPSLEALSKNINIMQVDINLQQSIVGLKDVLIFAPQLTQQDFFKKNKNGRLKIAANVSGRMNALAIQKLQLSGLGHTEISLKGRINGLPDANKIDYNLNIAQLQSSRKDLESLLPKATLQQIRLPDRFGIVGTLSGTATTYKPNILLASTDGNAYVKGLISIAGDKGNEQFDLALKTQHLNIGHIIRDTNIGAITATLQAKGKSFDIKKIVANANGNITSATYNKYTYHDVQFDGKVAAQKATINLTSNDDNAKLKLKGEADLSRKYPSLVADLLIDSIDLEALHFYASTMKIRAMIHADIKELNPDYPNGTVIINRPTVATQGQNYFLDSLYIVAKPNADSGNNIKLNLEVAQAHIWGHTPLTKIGTIIQSHIDRHYQINDSIYATTQKVKQPINLPSNYDLHLFAKLQNHPLVQGFVPALTSFDTIKLETEIRPSKLYVQLDAPSIIYGTNTITDTKLNINGTDSALTYLASVKHFEQGSVDIWYGNVAGELSRNTITSRIAAADVDSTKRFGLSALLERNGAVQTLQLGDDLMLNYKQWQVNQPNKIVFAKEGFYVQNFGIRNSNEYITVNSTAPHYNTPIKANISNFLLSNITEVISKDTLLANGILVGTVDVKQLNSTPQVAAALKITNLSVLGDTIGNLSIDVSNATDKAVDATVAINGHGNDIKLTGMYYPTPVEGNNFNMDLLLAPLNVKTIEGATANQIRNTTGLLNGKLHIQGTMTNPIIEGELKTDNLSTNIAMLNSQFTLPSEIIGFHNQNIIFNNFTIKDSAGNAANLDGKILASDLKNLQLDLALKARKWRAVNSTSKDNKSFYGKLFITTDLGIQGPVAAPIVDGKLDILKGTAMTVIIPEKQISIQDRDGIVVFKNIAYPNKYVSLGVTKDTFQKPSKVPLGSQVNMNIGIDEEAEFSVVIDQGTGDFLRVKGKADLNTTVAPDGTVGLVGTYEIMDGAYQLNYNFIKRLFRIQPGSKIIFAGDPTTAEVDITAVYVANVPPYDLVEKQIADPAQLVYYKQRLPFEVNMKLKGELLKPDISFDIILPDGKSYRSGSDVVNLVQNKLTDLRNNPSDLNKQVFALIILNRFVADNPFESDAGGGVEGIARQSASRFISEQLNKFAGSLIKGLDLTLDLVTSEDYTTGEKRNKTDLNIGASKRLLDDRLTVTVGNNFQLEGPRSNAAQSTSYIPGNLAVDYDITRNRRYRARVYRRNEDLGIDGFVVKTGVSFIVTLDYNKFRNVLMGKKKRQRLKAERKANQQEQQEKDSTSSEKDVSRK